MSATLLQPDQLNVSPGGAGGGGTRVDNDSLVGISATYSDEFDGTSLDGRWSQITNVGDLDVTTTVGSGWLSFEPTTSGNSSTGKRGGFGLRQTAPSGDFTVIAKIADVTPTSGDDMRAGIFAARTSDNRVYLIGSQRHNNRTYNVNGSTSGYSQTAEWALVSAMDVYSTARGEANHPVYFKLVWDSGAGTLGLYFSEMGMIWELISTISAQTQFDRIGLVLAGNTQNCSADHTLCCDYFRVIDG